MATQRKASTRRSPSTASGHKPASGQAAPKRLSQQSKVRTKRELEDFLRANGNYAVAKRIAIVAPALENLGYTEKQAQQIALDAPLNASMYDEQVVRVALEHARRLSDVAEARAAEEAERKRRGIYGQAPAPDDIQSSLADDAIPMPVRARAALEKAQMQTRPVEVMRQRLGKNTNTLIGRAQRRIQPLADKLGNLPVPGGLGSLFFLNLVFLAAIVPANAQGFTRLQLLWLTLMNRTDFPDENFQPQMVPASPIVQAALDTAQAVQGAAIAIGSLGKDAQSVVNVIQQPGSVLANATKNIPVVGGVLGGLSNITGGVLSEPIPNPATGNNPPPPPSGPTRTL